MQSCLLSHLKSELRSLEFGKIGRPILFIHGLGCTSSFEYPDVANAPALAGRRVVLLDLLGSGYSDRPETFGYTIQDHADVVAEFVETRGFPEINLFGHSMGGTVAIVAATLLGERVRSLVLGEPNLDAGGGTFSCAVAATPEEDYVASGHGRITREAAASGNGAWAATMRASDARATHRAAKSLIEGGVPPWREQLYGHGARKTVIFGARSLPDDDVSELPRHDVQTRVVENAGHSLGIDNPAGLSQAIGQSLAP